MNQQEQTTQYLPAVKEGAVGWVLIPPSILMLEDLTLLEKVLLGRINGLATDRGYCYASNAYLAQGLGRAAGTVSNAISGLVDKGLLHRELTEDSITHRTTGRHLFPLFTPLSIACHVGVDIPPTLVGKERERKAKKAEKKKGSGKSTGVRAAQHFPKEDYTSVTEAYKHIKHVEPQGSEWRPIQQCIKTMFLSGRTPDQIIGCMEAFEKSDEEWTGNWTMDTVRRKLPEHVAGRLFVTKGKNDLGMVVHSRGESAYAGLGARR